MKKEISRSGAAYTSPVAVPVEIPSEGILCASFINEGYEGAENYGDTDSDNKGWY